MQGYNVVELLIPVKFEAPRHRAEESKTALICDYFLLFDVDYSCEI